MSNNKPETAPQNTAANRALQQERRPRSKPRTTKERLADMTAFIKRIGGDAYVNGDEDKANRCKAAVAAINAIETPREAAGKV